MQDDTTKTEPVTDAQAAAREAVERALGKSAAKSAGAPAPAEQKTEDAVGAASVGAASVGAASVGAASDGAVPQEQPQVPQDNTKFIGQIVRKIDASENILIALSRNPAVDEIASAIGLALYLEKLGKHTTAIYSGETPNVLEFLRPEETFVSNTDSLQDFIIALNKEKADHLRYKVDGDYVKVFITPYRTTIGEEDLEFSKGDYNVDLVMALNVPTASDLDAALSEHGRIMHDAAAIDITTGEPGRFGEIEWSDPAESSVSEMVANLLMSIKNKGVLTSDVATALLTGIVSATNRFSNDNTKSSTMVMASKLMDLGANQQLVAMNLMENAPIELIGAVDVKSKNDDDATRLDVAHEEDAADADKEVVSEPVAEGEPEVAPVAAVEPAPATGVAEVTPMAEPAPAMGVEPSEVSAAPAPVAEEPKDYAQMMEEALKEPLPGAVNPAAMAAPIVASGPEENHLPEMSYEQPVESAVTPEIVPEPVAELPEAADAGLVAPEMPSEPAALGDDSYLVEEPPVVVQPLPAQEIPMTTQSLPMPDDEGMTLPPPPTPDVDFGVLPEPVTMPEPGVLPEPVIPEVPEAPVAQPVAQPEAVAQTVAPGTFQIPGQQ